MGALTPELEKERIKILKIAENVGLDCFDTVFELVSYKQLNQIAAQGGFPVRYPHWRFGMDYESISKGYEYGLSKIYELVINTNPCYAYLMEGNEFLDQKLVMAHVYGHCDFFKNNMWFSKTNRKMLDVMANHATRVRRYVDKHGIDVVEDFIDKCLSIENLIDRHSPYSNERDISAAKPKSDLFTEHQASGHQIHREYLEACVTPENTPGPMPEQQGIFPEKPEKDVLKFLIYNAPLEDWQQDVLSIIRNEAYYFAPQGMTKIMNEGWASYWHSKLMTEQIMSDSEIVDFADKHSGTMAMAPGGFNPYKVGIELFRDIKQRYDKGQFGLEWEGCSDYRDRDNWDTKVMKGEEKIFQIRRDYNDVTFVDEFLTEKFCVENKMFVYKFNKRTGKFEIDTKDFKAIKQKFLSQLTNFGQPIIKVLDSNFRSGGELLLGHLFEGVGLQPDYMNATLKNLQAIWKKPVNIATVADGESKIFRYDGNEWTHLPFTELPSSQVSSAS